jgi:ribosomal protein L24E
MPDYPKEDCYDTLGVHPEASQDVIKVTWKRLAKIYHSDAMSGAASRDVLAAQEKLKKINEAYDLLKDTDRRRTYDQWRTLRSQPPRPTITPSNLNFGAVPPGELRTERVVIDNRGGPVTGEINFSLANDPSSFSLAIGETNGFPISVDISIDTSDFSSDQSVRDTFTVTLDGISAEASLLAHIRSPRAHISTPPFSPTPSVASPTAGVGAPVARGTASTPSTASKASISRGWAIAAGWVAGFIFAEGAGPVVARVMLSVQSQSQPAQWLGACGVAWLFANAILVGVFVTGAVSHRRRMAKWAAGAAASLTVVLAILISVAAAPGTRSTTALPVEDKLIGRTLGSPTGIRWTHALGDRGALFAAADSSRIEYPGLIPREGTLEFWINVNDGYHYENSQFKANQNDAMIFSSDVQGGDVTWPGTTKLFVGRDGHLLYFMATSKYNKPPAQATEARRTKFRFEEWHAIGVSYGKQGQYIMLDGKLVASAPTRTQTFGVAGNHQQPLDIPTIGETVSHFWSPHRYEGGFEGTLAAFRVSDKQRDWVLAKGVNNPPEVAVNTSVANNSHAEILGRWEAEDGAQFVEFSSDNRCTRTEWDIQAKAWKTITGEIRVATDGGIFCSSQEGGNGVYYVNGENSIGLDYGMGGKQELFHRGRSSVGESQAGAQEPDSPNRTISQPPVVTGSTPGQYSLQLNSNQQSAVSLFLTTHPDMQTTDCQTLGYTADACAEAYAEWKTLVLNAKAEVQYPYAAWGDFNRDGLLDFVVPFFGRTPVNNWGWRKWYVVVFEGTQDGRFTPVIAAEDQWGACFDGMLYHPLRQQIEFWCKSAGGSFRWDGSRYVAKRLIGD